MWRSAIVQAVTIAKPFFFFPVAYFEAGQFAADVDVGSRYGLQLVWMLLISSVIAILMQLLARRLGVATGKHLAQVCRDLYPPLMCQLLWVLSEISMMALDVSVLIGTAGGLHLLLGWPLLQCIVLAGTGTLQLVLSISQQGFNWLQHLLLLLMAGLLACCVMDLLRGWAPLSFKAAGGLHLGLPQDALYSAVSLLGAHAMHHNPYLHSALASNPGSAAAGILHANNNLLQVACSLAVALLINFLLIAVPAARFYSGFGFETMQDAQALLGQATAGLAHCNSLALLLLGCALVCGSLLSSVTTAATGQLVLQGFFGIHVTLGQRHLATRAMTLLPVVLLQYAHGDAALYRLLLAANVMLAVQLPLMLVLLAKTTSSSSVMGGQAKKNRMAWTLTSWAVIGFTLSMNIMLFGQTVLLGGRGPQSTAAAASKTFLGPMFTSWQPSLGVLVLGAFDALSFALQLWMVLLPIRQSPSTPPDNAPLDTLSPSHAPQQQARGPLDATLQRQVARSLPAPTIPQTPNSPCCMTSSKASHTSPKTFPAPALAPPTTAPIAATASPTPAPTTTSPGMDARAAVPSVVSSERATTARADPRSELSASRHNEACNMPGSPQASPSSSATSTMASAAVYAAMPIVKLNTALPADDACSKTNTEADTSGQSEADGQHLLSNLEPSTDPEAPTKPVSSHNDDNNTGLESGIPSEAAKQLTGAAPATAGLPIESCSSRPLELQPPLLDPTPSSTQSATSPSSCTSEGAVQFLSAPKSEELPSSADKAVPAAHDQMLTELQLQTLLLSAMAQEQQQTQQLLSSNILANAAGFTGYLSEPQTYTSGILSSLQQQTPLEMLLASLTPQYAQQLQPTVPASLYLPAWGQPMAMQTDTSEPPLPSSLLAALTSASQSMSMPMLHSAVAAASVEPGPPTTMFMPSAAAQQQQQQLLPAGLLAVSGIELGLQLSGTPFRPDIVPSHKVMLDPVMSAATPSKAFNNMGFSRQPLSEGNLGSAHHKGLLSMLCSAPLSSDFPHMDAMPVQKAAGGSGAGGRAEDRGSAAAAGGGGRNHMTRGARKQLAMVLDEFWGRFYDQHGHYMGSNPRQGASPLVCVHTGMSHLCTACSQDLYNAVHQCLTAVGKIEGASASLVEHRQQQLLLLQQQQHRMPVAARMAPSSNIVQHDAIVMSIQVGDVQLLYHQCAGLYTSQTDKSRLLASMPLSSSDAVGSSISPDEQQQQQQQQQQASGSTRNMLSSSAPHSILSLSVTEPLGPSQGRALMASQSFGSSSSSSRGAGAGAAADRVPTMNEWCLIGPAGFVSFGVWCLSMLLHLCQVETRPELWGKYAYVLNKLQGFLRDSKMEILPSNGSGGAGSEGSSATNSGHGGSGQLPQTAIHLNTGHVRELRADILWQLQVLELGLADKKGPAGTAAGEIAFPKGKEIMLSVIKRYRRKLGATAGQQHAPVAPASAAATMCSNLPATAEELALQRLALACHLTGNYM